MRSSERRPTPEPPEPRVGPATPESVAATDVPPAAEAIPTVRDRASAAVGGILLMFAGGFGLLATALFASEQATTVAANAVAGALVLGLAVCAVTAIFSTRAIAIAGAAVGVALVVSALLASPLMLPDWGRLVVGGALGLACVGTIATLVRDEPAETQPDPRIEATI
jgi:hypothetical protein